MTDSDRLAQQVLDLARGGHEPSAGDHARILETLRARYVADPALFGEGAGLGVPAAGAKVSLGVKGWLAQLWAPFGFGIGVGVAGLAGVSVLQSARSPEAPAPAHTVLVATSPRTIAPALAAEMPAAESPLQSQTPTSTRPVLPSSGASAQKKPRSLDAEIELLRSAQAALHQGNASAALSLLNTLDRRVPNGVLGEERAATRALATCSGGAAGAAISAEFAQRFPQSVHLRRVHAACGKQTFVEPTE